MVWNICFLMGFCLCFYLPIYHDQLEQERYLSFYGSPTFPFLSVKRQISFH